MTTLPDPHLERLYNEVQRGLDMLGPEMNNAERLELLAPIGGVLISDELRFHREVEGQFEFE